MKQVGTGRREQNKARTRTAILRAARAVMAQNGIAGATMDEIAERAKISRATLFNYFAGKGEIVAELVEQMDRDFVALIDRYAQARLTLGERIVGAFAESARGLEASRGIVRRLVGVSEQSWGEGTGPARLARLTAAFTRLLDLGEQGSGMPQGVDGSLVAEMLVSIYVGQVHNWRISDGYPLEERLSAAGRFIAAAVECATEPDSRVAADPDK